jgi:hypothetical protein
VASIPTVCITFLGLHFGLVLVHIKDHQARIIHWAVLSAVLMALGLAIQ